MRRRAAAVDGAGLDRISPARSSALRGLRLGGILVRHLFLVGGSEIV